jgi:hypothetical protein
MKRQRKFTLGPDIATPVSNCLGCGTMLDCANGMNGGEPSPGDFTVCLTCGHLMAFADDLSIRPLTHAEMIEAAGNESILAIQSARGKLKAVKGKS